MTARALATDRDLLALFGIDRPDVIGFTLRVRNNGMPTLVVHSVVDELQIKTTTKRYALIEISPTKAPASRPLPSLPTPEGGQS